MPKVGESHKRQWTQEQIIVNLDTGGKRSIQAMVCAGLAIHPAIGRDQSPDGETQWVLTSATTGMLLVVCHSEVEVRVIAEILFRHCKNAFLARKPVQILNQLPRWIRPWLIQCRRKRKAIDHQPYREEYDS